MLLFFVYNFLLLALFPIILVYYIKRLIQKKESVSSFIQKFDFKCFEKPQKYDIWLHAASVGELKSLDFIIQKYLSKNRKILITTATLKSKEIALQYKNSLITHKFLPLDFLFFHTIFFLKHRVKNIIITESEIWPNLFFLMRILKKKSILFNARISKNSQKKWKYFSSLLRFSLKSFLKINAQSIDSQKFLQKYYPNIEYFGNIKMLNLMQGNLQINKTIKKFSHTNKPIMCIASTHIGEDEGIINAISLFKNEYNFLYLPRHPHRAKEISIILESNNISYSLLSSFEDGKNCLIIDEIGLLVQALSLSNIAIYGGSFLPHLKGHNILEAGQFGCKIITGQFTETFDEIINPMLEANAIIQTDLENLQNAIKKIIGNEKIGKNAQDYIIQNMPIIENIYKFLNIN